MLIKIIHFVFYLIGSHETLGPNTNADTERIRTLVTVLDSLLASKGAVYLWFFFLLAKWLYHLQEKVLLALEKPSGFVWWFSGGQILKTYKMWPKQFLYYYYYYYYYYRYGKIWNCELNSVKGVCLVSILVRRNLQQCSSPNNFQFT